MVVTCVVVCHCSFFYTTTGVPKKVGNFQILHVLKVPSGPFDHYLFFSILCFDKTLTKEDCSLVLVLFLFIFQSPLYCPLPHCLADC